MTAVGPNDDFSNMSADWVRDQLKEMQGRRRQDVSEIQRLRALLHRCEAHLFNSFEPDNQSQLYKDISDVLGVRRR